MPRINPHIDICNELFTTTSVTYTPTDHSTGIIEWDPSKYSPLTEVYFEVTGGTIYGGVPNGEARATYTLYNLTDSTYITQSEILIVSISSTAIGHDEAISTDIKAYMPVATKSLTVRFKMNNVVHTGYLLQARIVVIQDGNIIATRIHIPVGWFNNNNTTSFTEKESKRYFLEIIRWKGTISANFHATLKSTITTTNSTELYDLTGAAQLCVVTSASTGYNLQKTTFTWPTTDKEITVRIKNSTTAPSYLSNAHIVLDLSDSPSKFELPLLLFPNEATSTVGIPVSQPDSFHIERASQRSDVIIDRYFEACIKTSSATYFTMVEFRTGIPLDDYVHGDLLWKIQIQVQSNDPSYVRKTSDILPAITGGNFLQPYYFPSAIGTTATLSSARLIDRVNGFSVSLDSSFPFQILTKQIADASLPLEILKKLTADQTFPLENLTGVINPDATIVTDITTLRPNDFGAKQDLIPFPAPDNWLNASEISEDDDVSYNEGGNGASDLYGLDHHSVLDNKKIRQVQIFARVKGGATGNLGRIVYAIPAQSEQVYEMPYSFSLTIGYVNYSYLVQRNPVTSALFSAADIDDFQIGWKSETNSATASRVTQMWCVVTFELPL